MTISGDVVGEVERFKYLGSFLLRTEALAFNTWTQIRNTYVRINRINVDTHTNY